MSLLTDVAARFQWSETLITLVGSGVPEQIAQPSPARFAIGFSSNGANPIVISTHQDYNSGNGIKLVPGQFIWLDLPKHGVMPQQGWYVTSASPLDVLIVFEVTDNEG